MLVHPRFVLVLTMVEKKQGLINRLGRFSFKLAVVLLLVHFFIEATGYHYLYTTLSKTVFQGRLGPDILEYREMANATVHKGNPQPWPTKAEYGNLELSDEDQKYHEKNESVSFVVIHRDSLLFEQYWQGFGPDSISNSFSMAKSIVSALIGIAIDEGKLEGVTAPVYKYMPQFDTELGRELTVKHLLTMSSGMNFDEDYLNPFAFPAKANYGKNLELLLQEYQLIETPGKYFKYQSGSTQILAFLVAGVTRTDIADYASAKLWRKIGAENDALWSRDRKNGMEKAFCCFNSTARDFARIGKLYKDHGKWNGVQIIDSAYVAASVRPSGTLEISGEPCEIYGYQWWIGEDNGLEFFFMRGIQGQYVLVVPEKDLIVVRMGRKRDFGKRQRPHPDDVYRYLNMGLEMIDE